MKFLILLSLGLTLVEAYRRTGLGHSHHNTRGIGRRRTRQIRRLQGIISDDLFIQKGNKGNKGGRGDDSDDDSDGTPAPTRSPVFFQTSAPTFPPSISPAPTTSPASSPTLRPTFTPRPTGATTTPMLAPTRRPTSSPTPTMTPTTAEPTMSPAPTSLPSNSPTTAPTITSTPTQELTSSPDGGGGGPGPGCSPNSTFPLQNFTVEIDLPSLSDPTIDSIVEYVEEYIGVSLNTTDLVEVALDATLLEDDPPSTLLFHGNATFCPPPSDNNATLVELYAQQEVLVEDLIGQNVQIITFVDVTDARIVNAGDGGGETPEASSRSSRGPWIIASVVVGWFGLLGLYFVVAGRKRKADAGNA